MLKEEQEIPKKCCHWWAAIRIARSSGNKLQPREGVKSSRSTSVRLATIYSTLEEQSFGYCYRLIHWCCKCMVVALRKLIVPVVLQQAAQVVGEVVQVLVFVYLPKLQFFTTRLDFLVLGTLDDVIALVVAYN